MLKQFLKSLTVIGVLSFSSLSFAADGSSGCGPAWYLLKDNSLVSSALRATTNGILFPVVTIGMTAGTSNCTQHKLVLKEKESLYFATMNPLELKMDIAKGDGEYIGAFGTTMGCSVQSIQQLSHELKHNFQKIYPKSETKPEDVLVEVYKVILTNPYLTKHCSLG